MSASQGANTLRLGELRRLLSSERLAPYEQVTGGDSLEAMAGHLGWQGHWYHSADSFLDSRGLMVLN